MADDKFFLTYNQQMRHLRDDKNIDCHDSRHKNLLIRTGYFNLINGYKNPFICDTRGNVAKGKLPTLSVNYIICLIKTINQTLNYL